MATTDKYDRQLRLWGANGQRALMNSRILLVNADAVGTETLKNLVLPGVGHITVLDNNVVTHEDLGVNFFVDSSSLGRHRAEVVTNFLVEMNPDVKGTSLVGTIGSMIAADPNFLSQFNLVVTANLTEDVMIPLATECWERRIPLLVTRAYGLIGYCRVQVREHNIVESRPDASQPDLRIANPFPELSEFSSRFDLSTLDSMHHSHVPWVVILCQALAKWKSEHGGSGPKTTAEQNAFKELVKSASINTDTGEQNFREALDFFNISQAFSNRKLDDEIIDLINQVSALELNKASTEFDIMVRALGMFISKTHGEVPLSGMVPDMTSTSEYFVDLQQAYQSKATTDKLQFKAIVSSLLSSVGRSTDEISDESIDIFCKNVFNIRKMTTRSMVEEYASPNTETFTEMTYDLYVDPPQTPLLWYICLRAADRFQSKTGAFPGVSDSNDSNAASLEADAEKVWQEILGLVKECGQDLSMITHDHAREITRYGAGELHNVAALIGGVAGQEAVKLITHQFVPMDDTFIYNAIAGVGGTYKL